MNKQKKGNLKMPKKKSAKKAVKKVPAKKTDHKVVLKTNSDFNGVTGVARIKNNITGPKISFTHRHAATIDTGVKFELPEGYVLCFSLVPSLAERGMVATNAPGRIRSGELQVRLNNFGKEIVDVRDGDPLVNVWVEQVIPFEVKGE